jgi:tight adherence protein C
MILILLIGLVLIGVSAALFARLLLHSRRYSVETMGQIGAYGFEASGQAALPTQAPPSEQKHFDLRGTLDRLANRIGGAISGRVDSVSEDNLRRYLMAAGFYTLPPRRFVGYQVLATLGAGTFWLWLALSADVRPIVSILGGIAALAGGWTLPLTYVKRRGRSRAEQIDYAMPDLIDLLVTTVEAGLSFNASLRIATKRFRGPLGDELRLTLQEQSMGLSLNAALEHMVERCDTPSIRSFVRSMLQGEQLGVSIGQTLRNLGHEMRTRRRQMAEERAHKAPVKIVFPVVLFIFPATLLIMLGPAYIRIHAIFH